MPSKLRRLIGSRAFYAMVLAVVLPIIVQNAITNFVNLLDNLMVGRTGTEPMSGVAISNQLIFVFNLAIFGTVSGAGIFSAQYHGAGNNEGVRASFRYKFYISLMMLVIAYVLFLVAGPQLVSLYLNDSSDPVRVQKTLDYALKYLYIMLIGMIPFTISQCYSSTLRETGETALPMYAGVVAVFINLIFNYLLIFGKFGFPAMGVAGAAWATVISRYVEAAIIIIYTHTHSSKHPFAKGLYRTMRIPMPIVRAITRKGTPLLVNELLWASGMAIVNQIYSVRGLDVVAATNISSTIYNLFGVVYLAMGTATSIIIGQDLGANEVETAKDHSVKLMAFSVFSSVIIGAILVACSAAIPRLYNTTDSVRHLATELIRISAYIMPFHALVHCTYFIVRSGGKTGITFLFDSGVVWCALIPVALAFTYLTNVSIVIVYLAVQLLEIPKTVIGLYLIKKGIWINNIVSGAEMKAE